MEESVRELEKTLTETTRIETEVSRAARVLAVLQEQ
jgi:hypothetical protein